MAEYYPLLERAVAGLQDATPASRKAIYDRARNALLGQLRAMQPPIPEEDVQRESVALDDAIARLEERLGKEKPRPAPKAPAPVRPAMPAPQPPAPPPGLPLGTAPPVAPPPLRDAPVAPARAAAPVAAPRISANTRPPAPAAVPRPAGGVPRPQIPPRVAGPPPGPVALAKPDGRLGPAAMPAEALSVADDRRAGAADGVSGAAPAAAEPASEAMAAAAAAAPDGGSPPPSDTAAPVLPVAPTLAVPPGPAPDDPFGLGQAMPIEPAKGAGAAPPKQARSDTRPAAPRPASIEPRSIGFYVVICVAVLLVGGIAIAAWKLRDRPEQVIAAKTDSVSPDQQGKVVDRASESDADASRTAEPAGDTATVPAPIPQSGEQAAASATDAQQAPAQTAPVQSNATTASIPVSQRAALLVDAPDDPQKVKTYVGSVVWRSESVSPGQDQPLSTAVRADVDIPDAKLTMSLVLKKNFEPQFPASHTLELHFAELPDNTLGPVKQINVPEMRKDDTAPTGDPLTGVPVSITDDYFLVGLSRGAAEAPNLQLLADRNWVDVSVLLKSGKVAKITFEKGTSGQRILDEALKSWK